MPTDGLFLSDVVDGMSAASGFSSDVIRFLLCTLVNIPLGLLFHGLLIRPAFVPRNVVHIASLSIGLFYMVFCFGPWGPLHMFVSSTFVLVAMHFLPKTGRSALLVWVWALGYLSVMHLHRLFTDYGGYTLDPTGPQMIVTIKLTSYAWNLVDGWNHSREPAVQHHHQHESHLSTAQSAPSLGASHAPANAVANSEPLQAPRRPTLNSYQKAHMISADDPPSPLEFYAFIFFFPSILAGPGIEFMDYYRMVNAPELRLLPSWSSLLLATLRKLAYAAVVLPLVVAQSAWPVDVVKSAAWLHERALPLKLFDVWLYGVLARSKYYFAWGLAEVGFVSSGYSYRPATVNQPEHWNAARNVEPLAIEFPPEFSYVPRLWNIATHEWLKNHVFFRLPFHRSFNAPVVFAVSAFWHGFYPSYFAAFANFFIVDIVDRMLTAGPVARFGTYRYVGKYVHLLHSLTVAWLVDWCGMIFLLLVPSDLWNFLVATKFAGLVLLAILGTVAALVPPPKAKPL